MYEKKRILQVGYASLAKAGIQAVIMNIARGVKDDFDIDVLLTSNNPGYYDEEFLNYGRIYRINCDVSGCALRRYLLYSIRPFKQFFCSYRLLKRNQYDIVHLHGETNVWPIFLAAKFARVKHIIAHSHNTASPEKRPLIFRLYKKLGKWVINKCSTVKMGVSMDAIAHLYGAGNGILLNNPVEIDRFANAKAYEKKADVNLVNVGRYDYQKNQSFIIDITKCFVDKGYFVKTQLIGFGEEKEMLKKQIADLNINGAVELIQGNGDVDIPRLLVSADLFVFPSRYEGLGIVALEAQAAGLLCLASDVVPKETDVGLCEYMSLSEPALVWAEKIISMIQNRDNYKLDYDALNSFKAENIQKEICQFYKTLINAEIDQ